MQFAHPKMLALMGVTLPALAGFLWWAWKRRQALIAQFVHSRLLAQLTVGISQRRMVARLVLQCVAVAMIFLALAGPRFGMVSEQVTQRGVDILVAVDTSRSMLATDVQPNRLGRAKLAALDLLDLAKQDRLGLIAFAGTAFLQCPLTIDDSAFRQSVAMLEVGLLPQGGTALADVIEVAKKTFATEESANKALIILTDGEDQDGGAVEMAAKAGALGIRIFTIGLGSPEGSKLRIVDERGRTSFVRDEDGKDVVSKLNRDLLVQIARAADGDYLELKGAKVMENLYHARLAAMPKTERGSRVFQQFKERFQWPLGGGLLLLLIEMFFCEQPRGSRRDRSLAARNPSLAPGAAALLTFLLVAPNAFAFPSKGMKQYDAGKYKDAWKTFEQMRQRHPDDPKIAYNAGTAAYQAGEYQAATNALNSALTSSDPAFLEQAYYNLANAHYKLGEATEDPKERVENWKQALQHYGSALKLRSQDDDAKFNRELVTKKLQELQQQDQKDQQDQDSDPKDDKDKDKKDSKQQQQQKKQKQKDSSKDQNKKDQDPKQSQQEQSKDGAPQQDQEKDQQQQQENQKQQDQQNQQQKNSDQDKPGKQPDDGKDQQAAKEKEKDKEKQKDKDAKKGDDQAKAQAGDQRDQAKDKDKDKAKPGQPKQAQAGQNGDKQQPQDGAQSAEAAAAALGRMTPEQAAQLLESVKGEDQPFQYQWLRRAERSRRTVRDW